MTKCTKIIYWPILWKIFSKNGGNHFKRYIMCANYELLFSKMLLVFKIFVNELIQKLLLMPIW